MTFSEAIADGFGNSTNFSGRLVRSGYWWWALFALLVGVVAELVDLAAGTGPLLQVVTSLGLVLPGWSVLVRRLHDVDKSGWTWLWVLTIVGILYVLYLLVQPGSPETNRYGPDPRLHTGRGRQSGDMATSG